MTSQAISPTPDHAAPGQRSTAEEARIPALTGIRGVAVLLVMYLHLLPDAIWPGQPWVKRIFQTAFGGGVDLFFVLSGFLITGILLDTKGRSHYFRNFFARRFLRIFPLYYGTLALVFIVLPALGLLGGAAFEPVRRLAAWHWAYLSNVAWFMFPDGLASPQIELRHFWSLAVEEHFYLIWPFVAALASRRAIRWICVAIFAASLGLRITWTAHTDGFSLFVFLTPCHLDALAAGAFLAALVREADWRRWIPAARVCCGLAALAMGAMLAGLQGHGSLARSVGIALLALVLSSGIFLVLSSPNDGLTSRALSCRFLLFFGKYSYGLYVIHGLLIPVLDRLVPAESLIAATGSGLLGYTAVATLKIALVIPIALASWFLFENPILKLKRFFR